MSDGRCPFCDPAPDQAFFETELVVGLWDRYPVSPGHALLIPRRHVLDWFEADPGHPARPAQRPANGPRGHQEAPRPAGFNIGEAAGQTVSHLHGRLIPRYKGDQAQPWILTPLPAKKQNPRSRVSS